MTAASSPKLSMCGVSKRFGAVVIAEGLDLEVPAGESLGIIGPNGAGKSTLMALVSGDLGVDAGRIELDGVDITRESAPRRAHAGIGRTYQIPRPFEGLSVFENALVAAQHGAGLKGKAAHNFALESLELSGLLDQANRLGSDIGLLGRKRIELARALATGPRLILLDEIAAGLTDAEVDELLPTIAAMPARGITVIWIEHVVRALRAVVDRLACLAEGRWLAIGTCDEVLADDEVQRVYLGTSARDGVAEALR